MLNQDAVLLKQEYEKLKSKLDDSFSGDLFIKKSIKEALRRLNDIININTSKAPQKRFTPVYKSLRGALPDAVMSPSTRQWRQNISIKNFNKIPDINKKEIFDCFFRYDTYGHLYNDDIIFLSRGVEDPQYFAPPAIVNVALDVANKQNWFGYSDPLGHIDTRTYIANHERIRWNKSDINYNNIAVIMGGTQGLDTVLSFIKKTVRTKQDFIVLAPTYAPIVESINSYFDVKKIELDDEYNLNYKQLSAAIKSANTAGILLSVPHNPMCSVAYTDIIKFILPLCKKYSKYIVIDEVYIQDKIYEISDILDYKKTIIITSYSKSYAIPGLKMGHLVSNPEFINKFYRHASTAYGSPPSFFYLVASCLAKVRIHDKDLDDCVARQFSNPDYVFTEFGLWLRQKQLFNAFNRQQIIDIFGGDSNYSLLIPDNNSCNIVLRADIRQPAYLTMLQLLTECNVSVMPIECFAPEKYTKHDMRITTSVNPLEFKTALIRIKRKMDDIIKQESADIKYILWDNDGVLVDTEKLFFDATKQALDTIGIKATHKDFEEISLKQGKNLIEYYGKKFGFSADKVVKKRDAIYSKIISHGVTLNPGIFDTIKKLKNMGFRNAIVTGSYAENFLAMHKSNRDFLSMFDTIITRQDYNNPKPAPDSYKYAMKKLNIKPSQCLVIEDSIRGIQSAIKCGIKFVHFKTPKDIFKQIKNKLCI